MRLFRTFCALKRLRVKLSIGTDVLPSVINSVMSSPVTSEWVTPTKYMSSGHQEIIQLLGAADDEVAVRGPWPDAGPAPQH